MSSAPPNLTRSSEDEKPPLLGSWKRIYIMVIVGNLIWLALAYFVTYIYA